MGRITIFVSNDINSRKVKLSFEKRRIPFSEINVEDHPTSIPSLKALGHNYSVPKVFFNTRYIGGVDETLKELKRWDDRTKYDNPLSAYESEIAKLADPQSLHLQLPSLPMKKATPKVTTPIPYVELPDGTATTTYWNMTEKLRGSISLSDYHQRSAMYKRTFSGKHALKAFVVSMDIDEEQARAFGNSLLKAKVIRPITNEKKFVAKESSIYRLQADSNPSVLNSYCIWPQETSKGAEELMDELTWLLADIEGSSLDSLCRIDYSKALIHEKFPLFEENVCELQAFDMATLNESGKKAFALNVYNLMLRYAFIKLGFVQSEQDRSHFYSSTSFNIGGLVFSFDEWKDGILRGNRKSPSTGKEPFNALDRRRRMCLSKLDPRIHFALGDHASVGSTLSLPFRTYSTANIEQELEMAASVFCNDKVNIRKRGDFVELHKTLYVYRGDFSTDKNKEGNFAVLATLAQYHIGTTASAMVTGECTVKFASKYSFKNLTRQATGFARYEKEFVLGDVTGFSVFLNRFKTSTKTPANERKRLATLRGLNLIDTFPEDRFDHITLRMQEEFGFPCVVLTLVDENRAWFKSIQWPLEEKPRSLPRGMTLCGDTINFELGGTNYVEDALEHPTYKSSALVIDGPKIRFYAGIPLAIPGADGNPQKIGALSLASQSPGKLNDAQIKRLHEYGAEIKRELLRRDSVSTAPTMSSSEDFDEIDAFDDFNDF